MSIPPPRVMGKGRAKSRPQPLTPSLLVENLPALTEEEMDRIVRRVLKAFGGAKLVPLSEDGHYLEPIGLSLDDAKREAQEWRKFWDELARRTKGTKAHVPRVRSIEVIQCPVCESIWVTSTRIKPAATRYNCREGRCPGVANIVRASY